MTESERLYYELQNEARACYYRMAQLQLNLPRYPHTRAGYWEMLAGLVRTDYRLPCRMPEVEMFVPEVRRSEYDN